MIVTKGFSNGGTSSNIISSLGILVLFIAKINVLAPAAIDSFILTLVFKLVFLAELKE